MSRYAVVKFFGHLRQDWEVEADSKTEAWETAEDNGRLCFQSFYRVPFTSIGYVVNMDEKAQYDPPLTEEEATKWLREAADLGARLTPQEYERCYGLPFHDVK